MPNIKRFIIFKMNREFLTEIENGVFISGTILKGAAIVLLLNLVGRVLLTVSMLLLSNHLGVSEFGVFVASLSLIRLFAVVSQFGANQSVVHFLSRFRVKKDWSSAFATFKYGLQIIGVGLAVMIVVFLLMRNYISQSVLGGIRTDLLFGILVLFILFTFNNYFSLVLRGLRKIAAQTFFFNVGFPLGLILSILILIATDRVNWVLHNTYYLTALIFCCIILVAVLYIVIIFQKKHSGSISDIHLSEVLHYSLPVWLNAMFTKGNSQLAPIMLGILATTTEIGLFGASKIIMVLVTFVLMTFNQIFQPLIAEAFTKNDRSAMSNYYNSVVSLSAFVILPITGGLIIFGDYVLNWFGPDFREAYLVLVIVLIAGVFNTVSGPAGTFLIMAKRQYTSLKIILFGFLLNVGLNLVLIPLYGAVGAAISFCISMITINVLRVKKIIQYFKIQTKFFRPLLLASGLVPVVAITLWCRQVYSFPTTALIAMYILLSGIVVVLIAGRQGRDILRVVTRR